MPASTSVFRKGPTLEALDQAAAGKTVDQLQQIADDLRQVQTGEELLGIAGAEPKMTPHVNHLRDHWFDGKAPYWPGLTDAASDFAKGLADALELMIPNAKAPKVLPLDCYWLAHGNTFTVVPELDTNAQTVRMIVITPKPNP